MSEQPFRVTFFPPDRPVEGNTVFIRPQPDTEQLPSWLAGLREHHDLAALPPTPQQVQWEDIPPIPEEWFA